jgi:hypothetical protein
LISVVTVYRLQIASKKKCIFFINRETLAQLIVKQ